MGGMNASHELIAIARTHFSSDYPNQSDEDFVKSLRAQIVHTHWSDMTWQNHVSADIMPIWADLSDDTRIALYVAANEALQRSLLGFDE